MKEVTFKGYVRNYGVRATGEDIHIIKGLYEQVRPKADGIFDMLCEVTVRVIDQRQDWIDGHYKAAKDAVEATDWTDGSHIAHLKFCKDTTIFIRHWIDEDDYVGVAAPRHGDKYDRKTGIAVAYAKAMGETVPDYI